MFQRFTSLFFSDSSTPENLEEPKPFVSEEEEEDGWLIIDLPEAVSGSLGLHSLPRGERERRNGSLHQNPPVHLLERLAPLLNDVPASAPPTLQEGPNPVSMESNPMEDLLIEHPSMSVYVTSTSIVVERESPEEHIGEGEVPDRRLQRHAPHHSTSLATKAAILEKVNQVRRIQRAKHLAEKHKFSQKVMQRQNRTRECRPRRAKHQGSFVYQPCQRQYNY